jgi:hypothetical protein
MTESSSTRGRGWLVPVALIALDAVPVAAGAARLTELAGGAQVTPENARFFASPVPVVVHIVCVSVYSFLGAVQFASGFRRRRPAGIAPPGGSWSRAGSAPRSRACG